MRHAIPGFGAAQSDPAVSAFVYLGEQLRARGRERTEADDRAMPAESAQVLLNMIEGEIIPRLLLAHRAATGPEPAVRPGLELDAGLRERFLATVMRETASAVRAFVDELLQRGVTQELVFLDLLPGAARRLGELWEEDLCDFSDVTIGLCRLHEVVREHSVVHEGHSPAVSAPRVLLATACADQHVLGVVLVAEFFRRAGWRVWSEPGAFRLQLAAMLAERSFDVIGLSAARSLTADEVAGEIESLRKASSNRALRVLVGGRLFVDSPELVEKVGADGSAPDARSAPGHALQLLGRSVVDGA